MKLVLSRKGFDSGYGGMPSPILPDGSLISLPIPSRSDSFTVADANFSGIDLGKLVFDLSKGRHSHTTKVHLDPDLDRPARLRLRGWRPALGQTGSSQSHLARCGVGAGDVFLFFGWFREAELRNGRWSYARGARDLHVLFGWLEVCDVLPIVTERDMALSQYPWIANHPHVASPDWYCSELNTLYVASEKSRFSSTSDFGAGRFATFKPNLQLTKPNCTRSVWSLPDWFLPNGRTPITYHPNPSKWALDGSHVTLQSAAKGQEFVIDGREYPELESWVSSIIREGAN